MDLQIGDKITWKAGNIVVKAVFLEEAADNKIKTIIHTIGDRPSGIEQIVESKIVKKENW
jgi:hypothetical protein